MTNNHDGYFAAASSEDIVERIQAKIREYYDDLSAEGILDLTRRMHKAYYGGDLSENNDSGLFASSKINEEGRLGYLKKYKANHFRNIVRHVLQLATTQRINYSPRATNTDYKSLAQATLSKGLLEYYHKEERLEAKYKEALEKALILLEGWIHLPWDETAGGVYETIETAEGEIDVERGDIIAETYSMLDVVRDISHEQGDHRWLCVRTIQNRHDLAAMHVELAEDILDVEKVNNDLNGYESFRNTLRSTAESDDQLIVWVFYHAPTPALRNGRVVKFAGDLLLLDAPFPYSKIPLNCVKGSTILGTGYGYSDAADLLGPQKALDITNAQLATNQFNLGISNVWTRSGETPNLRQLAEGMTNWQSNEEPKALNLVQQDPSSFELRKGYVQDLETLSGVNSTVRGNPPGANMSGAAQALLVSQAVSYSSGLEGSYVAMIEDTSTLLIDNIRRFSMTPRIVTILGEGSRPFTKEFVAEDLSEIARVAVDINSPMARTVSGRIELARLMKEMGMILTPYQLNNLLETGSLDPVIEGMQHEYLTIRSENEALRQGIFVPVLATDNHPEHINEHKAILSDPESRRNPQLIDAVLGHIQEHINVWRQTDPVLLQQLGIPPLPGPAEPPPPPQSGGTPGPEPQLPGPQQGQEANMPNMPNMPEGSPESAQVAYEKRQQQ